MVHLKRALTASALLLVVVSAASAQTITSNILTRVFLIRSGESVGSSFTVEVKDRQYLITARHVVRGVKDGDPVAIFHEGQWKSFPVRVRYPEQPGIDVAVLALPLQLSPTLPVLVRGGLGVYLSQEVYFLGYPFGLSMEGQNLNRGFPLPFVKKGIISAFIDGVPGYYLDAINNPGFSGGPVIVKEAATSQLNIIAVVSGYKNQEQPITMRGVPSTELVAIGNSGLLVAFGIQGALDVIEKNPIGFPVKK